MSQSASDPAALSGSCVTIGNFDGVHLGHQALVALAVAEAENRNLRLVLVTFWPHPRDLLIGPGAHKPLTMPAERKKLVAGLGVGDIREIEFTHNLAALSAEAFVRRYLLPMELKSLVIGHDFSLGKGREGSADRLLELGDKYGFIVKQAGAFCIDGVPVSSTRLRADIMEGNVAGASQLLGRHYALAGIVSHGHGRGAGLGFPTANLANIATLLPANGVYATYAIADGQKYQAVTNIGYNPTFGNEQVSVESFLLDADVNLYGKAMQLEFVARLRDERKFSSVGALAEQIALDVAKARAILSH